MKHNYIKTAQIVICPQEEIKFPFQKEKNLTQFDFDSNEMFARKLNRETKISFCEYKLAAPPLPLRFYNDLFNTLLKNKRDFFSSECGKTEIDFQNYIKNKTEMYSCDEDVFPKGPDLKFSLYKKSHESPTISSSPSNTDNQKSPKGTIRSSMKWNHSEPKDGSRKSEPFIYMQTDPEMLERGITLDPILVRPIKFILLRTSLTNPEVSWFPKLGSEGDEKVYYPDNKLCAVSFRDGTSNFYDNNGFKSLSFLRGRLGDFIVVYGMKKINNSGKYKTIPMAIFDLMGNGVVYDEDGKRRLIYDQAQGIYYDCPKNGPLKWKWKSYGQVMCRREEFRFMKHEELLDYDYHHKSPKFRGKVKIKKGQVTTFDYLSSNKKNEGRTQIKRKKSINNRSSIVEGHKRKLFPVEITTEKPRKPLKKYNIHTPAILRFSQGGCSIEPLLEPCQELGFEKTKVENISESTFSRKVKRKTFSPGHDKSKKDLHFHCYPKLFDINKCKRQEHSIPIKPIVMKITDTVSLIITSQEHIHIDFKCDSLHFIFNIGVTIDFDNIGPVYAVPNAQEAREMIPCIFEVMQNKCQELSKIYKQLKEIRESAETKSELARSNYLKQWGFNINLLNISESNLLKNEMDWKSVKCFCQCKRNIISNVY